MRRLLIAAVLTLAAALPAAAQSTAINGSIEGVITDESGAVLPGVTITVTNLDTGDTRVVVTNESGLYRAPLLSLGKYKVEAELQGFKKLEQTGINISAGQTAVISMKLGVGQLTETISVTADAPLVDLGKIEQGRTLTEAEIKTLPLTSRNPYNFALLQPGVVGFENQEFGVPRLTSNGALMRINYQIDGSNNTQKDRAGLRQMPMSEVMIREVKIVTTGYAPEFGQTMGLIYNAITPSGTNTYKGQGSYRLQRQSMVAFPFFTQGERSSDNKPPTEVNVYTFDIGGPIVKNRTHFFAGYEHTERDLSGSAVLTITPANQAALGLSEPRYMPRGLNTEFAIGKVDHQLNDANRLSVRYIFFDNFINNNVGGGIGSVERATDFSDRQHSTAAQLISTIRPTLLNELRVQYATRAQSRAPGSQAGTGPAINIANVANFGGPVASLTDAGFGFTQNVAQVNSSLTWLRGDHSFKAGIDIQHVADTRTSSPQQIYTFPTVASYLAARSGANPFGYNTFQQYFGEPGIDFSSNLYGMFVQDDWRLSDSLKVLYGLRYDLYDVPAPDANAPFETSRDFVVDKNNLAPRLGVVWTVGSDRRTVVRANSGVMYDQALLASYEQALINNGTNARASASFQPATPGAPAFPGVLSAGAGAQPNTLTTVSRDFDVAYNWQNNLQLERQLNNTFAASVGVSYSRGYNLPVISNINAINPIGRLADGRPIYSTAVNASTRLDPRYNVINQIESLGESTYKNITAQLTGRNIHGIQFDFAYTLGKAEDNAPITGVLSVTGDAGRTNPESLDFDKGPNVLDQRHTFSGSIVARPSIDGGNAFTRGLVNGTIVGVAMQFANGIPIGLRANPGEINNDGVNSDRPAGISRNSLRLPARYNVDMRLSRQVAIGGPRKVEVIAEVKNLFNTVQWSSVTGTAIPVDRLTGLPTGTVPTSGNQLIPTGGYEQRQLQVGFKFVF
ncbi:MAG: TonB-dependent receptor [Acidobacteria bacterium]|nr:TonB-dependent receptor [Acidobacteriota bacterium]